MNVSIDQVCVKLSQLNISSPPPPQARTMTYREALTGRVVSSILGVAVPGFSASSVNKGTLRQYVVSLIDEISLAPFSRWMELLQKLRSVYASDARYMAFFTRLFLLIECDCTGVQQRPILQILRGVFVDNVLSGVEAYILFSQLAFIAKESVEAPTLTALCQEIKTKAQQRVAEVYQEYVKKLDAFRAIGVYSRADLRCTLLPQYIAQCFLLPNGKINMGLCSLVKAEFFAKEEEQDDVERHASNILQELCFDKETVCRIEGAASGTQSVLASRLINATLLRPLDTVVTRRDVGLVALTACLSFWRQKKGKDCCPNSLLSQRQTVGLRWFVDDIASLFENGYILRDGVKFFGLEVSESIAFDAFIESENCIRGSWTEKVLQANLGLQEAHLTAVSLGQPTSLRKMFAALHLRWPSVYTHNTLDRVSFLIEAPNRNPCLTVLENALGSAYSPPIRSNSYIFSTHQKILICKLMNVLYATASAHKLTAVGVKILSNISSMHDFTAANQTDILQRLSDMRVVWSLSPRRHNATGCVIPGAVAIAIEEAVGIRTLTREEVASRLQGIFCRVFRDEYPRAVIPPFLTSEMEWFLCVNKVFGEGFFETDGFSNPIPSIGSRRYPRFLSHPHSESVPEFLRWLSNLRVTDDPLLSIAAANLSHQFRLLPNHPSLFKWDTVESLNKGYEEFSNAPLSSHPNLSITLKAIEEIVCYIVDGFSKCVTILRKGKSTQVMLDSKERIVIKERVCRFLQQGCCADRSFAFMVRFIADTILEETQETAVKKTNLSGTASLSISREGIQYRLFLGFVENHPKFKDLLLHFADDNYAEVLDDKLYAVHYCLWFNSQTNSWRIVTMSGYCKNSCMNAVSGGKISEIYIVDLLEQIRSEFLRKKALKQHPMAVY